MRKASGLNMNNLKHYFKILLLGSLIVMCTNNKESKIDTQSDLSGSTIASTSLSALNSPTNQDTTELHKIIQDYKMEYQKIIRIDTVVSYKNKKFEIKFDHHCLFDSLIKIPTKYVSYLGLREFITHNFESHLTVESNESTLLDTMINKKLFENLLFEELRKYGVLLYPNFSIKNDSMSVDYSISVPLTDVGIAASINYSFYGALKVRVD